MGYKFWKCANNPQSCLKTDFFFWNIPYLDYFHLGIQLGSTDISKVFGLPPTFVTWDNKVAFTKKIILKISKLWHELKISPILPDLCYILYLYYAYGKTRDTVKYSLLHRGVPSSIKSTIILYNKISFYIH